MGHNKVYTAFCKLMGPYGSDFSLLDGTLIFWAYTSIVESVLDVQWEYNDQVPTALEEDMIDAGS